MKSIRKKCSSLLRRTADSIRSIVRPGGTPDTSTDASCSDVGDSSVTPEKLAPGLRCAGDASAHPSGGGGGDGDVRRRRRQRRKKGRTQRQIRSYARYVRSLMRTIHPRRRISKAAIAVMDSFLSDMQVRLSEEARRLCRKAGRRTLKASDVCAAVQLLLPKELAVHARREAEAALQLAAASRATAGDKAGAAAAARTRSQSLPPS
ncbi:histone H2B type 2-K1-like [Schistocerca gregaria]|uniref:histone H2B type 2-K1-like n=1 Tax=Schistocerca gregaria TaxID=7010 RepID=UPI00211DE5D2|nr:histone H2B type 2-K1-like [Schistocerca gregaria]